MVVLKALLVSSIILAILILWNFFIGLFIKLTDWIEKRYKIGGLTSTYMVAFVVLFLMSIVFITKTGM